MTTQAEIQEAADQHYQSRFSKIERLITLQLQAAQFNHSVWEEDISERIQEMPLSVELVAVYPNRDSCEWEILLGTGGPADRVLVTTNYLGDLEEAEYQYQDWFTPWTRANDQDRHLVELFAQAFYFGNVDVNIS